MSLLEKIDGDTELLKRLSTFTYFLVKCAARNDFTDFVEDNGITMEEWNVLKEFLKENGLNTYC